MARVDSVPTPQLKLPPEGKLALVPLDAVLGRMGLLRASGVLELKHRKLVRRVIFDAGAIQALVSNARDDRFVDWWLTHAGGGSLTDEQREAVLLASGESPLTAIAPIRAGLLETTQLPALLAEHLMAILADCVGWSDATYRITPGRVPLGTEPTAALSAIDAGLNLARVRIGSLRRPPPPPQYVAAWPDWKGSSPALDPLEAELLSRCESSTRTTLLIDGDREGAAQREVALAVLVRIGLLIDFRPPERDLDEVEALAEITQEEVERWLAAAEQEQLEAMLGVNSTADAAQVRRAYYRTVRRFHPDRFRNGELAAFHARIESVFWMVHEALEVLTSSTAREAWNKRRQAPAAADPGKLARDLFARARRAIAEGRRAEAVEYLARAVENAAHEPTHALYLWLLLLGNPRRRSEACERLGVLAGAHPTRADLIAGYGYALKRCGREADGKQQLQRALQIDPTQPIARLASGAKGAFDLSQLDPLLGAVFAG